MKRKKIVFVIVSTLLLMNFIGLNHQILKVQSWGLLTHQYLVNAADDLMPVEWQEAFDYYNPEILQGCTYPDQVLQDWENHLYYPVGGEYNAPWKVNETIYDIRTMATNEEWGNVFFFLGIVSHYASDINIPVHTYEYWDGHPAYEHDINDHLGDFTVTPYDFGTITDPVQFIIDCATYAYSYYWDIRNAYPIGTEEDVVVTNSTIKSETEEQLGRAIGAIVAVWNKTLDGFTPPDITVVEDVGKVLVDKYHDNDYLTENSLTSFVNLLDRDILEVVYNDAPITGLSLAGVDLLVITQPMEGSYYNSTEIDSIVSWYETGGHILVSGKGDFYDTTHDTLNNLLNAIGSDIRLNDDSVYTTEADPEYYKDWYCNTDEYGDDLVALEITENLTRKIQFYSPCSLYSNTESPDVHWLMFGEEMFYQANSNPPSPDQLFDTTQDDVGGTSIPLAAVEVDGESSVAVFGSTIWSDYDAALTHRDNSYFVWNTIEFLLDIDLELNDDYEPLETTPTPTPTPTDTEKTSYSLFGIAIIGLGLLVFRIISHKKRKI